MRLMGTGVLVCLVFLEGLYGVLEKEREREVYIYVSQPS